MNSDWCLEKMFLGIRPIKVAHIGHNIVDHIEMVGDYYGIIDKIFSIILHNASSNKTDMDVLKPMFSSFIGHLIAPPNPYKNVDNLSVVFLHHFCACYTLLI